LLPTVIVMWATVGWLMQGVLIRGGTRLEWSAFLVFSWGLLIAVCALAGRLAGFAIEGFTRESGRAARRLGFGVVSGAVAGGFVAGLVTVSLANGRPGVPEKTPPFYWLLGPALAVAGGIVGMIVERNDEH
jgi:hypothetical protein